MMSGVLVLHLPTANVDSISESPLRPRSQPQGLQQAPLLEVAEQPQQGMTTDAVRDPDLAF